MKKSIEHKLAPAPAAVQRIMLEEREMLEPGAAAVVGRFFQAVKRHSGSRQVPSADCFREAARSESTFRCLLRALHRYAPHVSTAEAQEVSSEWYAKRPGKGPKAKTRRTPARPTVPWPPHWQGLASALERASIKESTRKRYRDSINRCACIVAEGLASERLGFLTAHALAEGFTQHPEKKNRVKPITAANYIDALISLAQFADMSPDQLTGMRVVTKDLRARAALDVKDKEERIALLMERGGFAYVSDQICVQRELSEALPPYSAAARRAKQKAVLCTIYMNKPPRKGDAVQWRIGHELVRNSGGSWEAKWEQEKTGHVTESGTLWPEVSELLDEWILGDRPDRLVHLRYRELRGCNWLTLERDPPYRNLPNELIGDTIGVPPHDLRTLAADYLRRYDPVQAANIIAPHLGHKTRESARAYRALCAGDAAQALWAEDRAAIIAVDASRKKSQQGYGK
ncbi:MAG: hypothetical protein ACP5EN_13430 [Rhodovulum sp.]